MTYYQLGQIAWIGHSRGQHDGLNPYKPGTDAHSEWEKGFQDKVNEQFKELLNEQAEKNPQQTIDF